MPTVTAIEPHDGHRPGAQYEASAIRAKELIHKGLVKMKGPTANKKQPENRSNKSSPSPAAGKGAQSSASPAAQASRKMTAKPSAGGDTKSQKSGE